ncbi:hypothetical protein Plhal304r1_c018g0065221 [Plasmopara halstedii]
MFSGITKLFSSSGDDAAKAAKAAGGGADDVTARAKTLSANYVKDMKELDLDPKTLKQAMKEYTKLPKTKMEKFKKVAKMAGMGLLIALGAYGTYKLTIGADGPPRTTPQTYPTI